MSRFHAAKEEHGPISRRVRASLRATDRGPCRMYRARFRTDVHQEIPDAELTPAVRLDRCVFEVIGKSGRNVITERMYCRFCGTFPNKSIEAQPIRVLRIVPNQRKIIASRTCKTAMIARPYRHPGTRMPSRERATHVPHSHD